jgi:hypothetical protein
MKPCVEVEKHLLAESEQQTDRQIINRLFDTYSVVTYYYQLRRVPLIIIRFTLRYYLCHLRRLNLRNISL